MLSPDCLFCRISTFRHDSPHPISKATNVQLYLCVLTERVEEREYVCRLMPFKLVVRTQRHIQLTSDCNDFNTVHSNR